MPSVLASSDPTMPTAQLPEPQPVWGSQAVRRQLWLSGCCSATALLSLGHGAGFPQGPSPVTICPSVILGEAAGTWQAIKSEADSSQEVRRSLSLSVYELRRSWFWPLRGLRTPLPAVQCVREWAFCAGDSAPRAGATAGPDPGGGDTCCEGQPGGHAGSGWECCTLLQQRRAGVWGRFPCTQCGRESLGQERTLAEQPTWSSSSQGGAWE